MIGKLLKFLSSILENLGKEHDEANNEDAVYVDGWKRYGEIYEENRQKLLGIKEKDVLNIGYALRSILFLEFRVGKLLTLLDRNIKHEEIMLGRKIDLLKKALKERDDDVSDLQDLIPVMKSIVKIRNKFAHDLNSIAIDPQHVGTIVSFLRKKNYGHRVDEILSAREVAPFLLVVYFVWYADTRITFFEVENEEEI